MKMLMQTLGVRNICKINGVRKICLDYVSFNFQRRHNLLVLFNSILVFLLLVNVYFQHFNVRQF